MTLAWDRSQDPDVVGYRLHYGTTSKGYDKTVDVGNTTTATVSNLTAGSGYYFAVSAYNSAQIESSYSNEVFKSIASALAKATLAWDRNTDPDVVGYRIRYGTSSGKYDKTLDVGGVNTATLPDLNVGSSYYAVVTAYNSAEIESLPSKELIVKVESSDAALKAASTDEPGTSDQTLSNDLAGTTTNDPARTALKASAPSGSNVSSSTESSSVDSAATEATPGHTFTPGKYVGVVTSSTPNVEGAGAINLNTTAAGKFTGKLTYGGKNYALKGAFNSDGTASVSLPRAKAAALAVTLKTSTSDSTGELSGTVSDGAAVSEIVGDRAVTTMASAHQGKWTVLLANSGNQSADAQVPQSQGYATINVTRNGTARLNGTLADGNTFSVGTTVSKNQYLYVYVPLYQKRGVLAGVLEFKPDAGTGATVTGSVQWVKPSTGVDQSSSPEATSSDLTATGEPYRKPTTKQPGAGYPSTDGLSTLTLSGGDLTETLSRTVSISAAGKVSVTDPGTEQLKMTINAANGTFSGSFRDAGANKPRRFSGVVLQTQGVASGVLHGSTDGGSVTLTPKK